MRYPSVSIRTILGMVVLIVSLPLLCSAAPRLGPSPGPKYLACPWGQKTAAGAWINKSTCNEDLGYDRNNPNTRNGCTKYCADGPMRFTPNPIEACAGEQVQMNVRIDGGRLDVGNKVDVKGGEIDWGDGGTTPLSEPPLNQDFAHTYQAAKTYYPSVTYGANFSYYGQGSCGYQCRLQQDSVAIIHLKTAPECVAGKFHAVKK